MILGPMLGAFVGAFVAVLVARRLYDARAAKRPPDPAGVEKLLDTSAIVDGRIAEVAEAGFLEGPLVVPPFVLRELQSIADASDPTRRARGRLGLEVLERLRGVPAARFTTIEDEAPEAEAVDDKLLSVARRRGAQLVTCDFNLDRVAGLRGVKVLNVNALAHAVRAAAIPGEGLRVVIQKEGREPDQGVGYLDDGTMVVVDKGRERLGETVDVVVTRTIQTAAGRMIFARLADA